MRTMLLTVCRVSAVSLLFVTLSCQGEAQKQQQTATTPEPEPTPAESLARPDADSLVYLTGRFDPSDHPDFEELSPPWAEKGGMYLRKEAYRAFKEMYAAADIEGIRLQIISATRPFNRQKQIWEAKWTGNRKVENQNLSTSLKDPTERALKILEYSSMPGTSRHHWGTDIDLNSLDPAFFRGGEGARIYAWLKQNGPRFGYCQVYSPKGEQRPFGYNEEAWHWSYMPLAGPLTRMAEKWLSNSDISGFQGAETADSIDVVGKFILGINPDCYDMK